MAITDLHVNPNVDVSPLSQFSFGLPEPDTRSHYETVDEEAAPQPKKRPGRSTLGDIAVAFLILGAAIVSTFGINRDVIARQFPQVAAVLHLATPAPKRALTSEADAKIRVWADLSTALYYCPGSALYGHTKSGRYLSQADAQLANFEPAARTQCSTAPSTVPGKSGPAHR